MPIYEYECQKCKQKFDLIQKLNDPKEIDCIHCEGKANRIISPAGFQLKGSGWYVTDFKNKLSQKANDKKDNLNVEQKKTANTETAKTEADSNKTASKTDNSTSKGEKN